MTTDAHHDALLAAVLAEPDRDEPRLICADWLEENGQPERAEFIRVQCEMYQIDMACGLLVNPLHNSRYLVLRERERDLLSAGPRWYSDIPYPQERLDWAGSALNSLPWDNASWHWQRGFVGKVECRCVDWLSLGKDIVQQQPLEKVTLSNMVPFETSRGKHWWFGSGQKVFEYEVSKCHLPHEIWLSFSEPLCDWHGNGRWYQSKTEAMTALSAACLAYAHSHSPA